MKPVSFLFGSLVSLRKTVFDLKLKKRTRVDRPVVVVGNITAGGTGKTPTLIYLLSLLEEKGVKAGVISRGYKGAYKGLGVVDISKSDCATEFGDEPCLIKSHFPKVPVFLHRRRVLAAQELILAHPEIEIILADDGFQHFALERDLDLVLIDSTESIDNYKLMPSGRLREPLKSLERANHIVFTKTNWTNSNQLKKLKELIHQHYPLTRENHTNFEFHLNFPKIKQAKVLLLSAIAKPQVFENSIKESRKVQVMGHVRFSDHHSYTKSDVEFVLKECDDKNCEFVLTTEKDQVKLSRFPKILEKLKTVGLTVGSTKVHQSLERELLNVLN